MRTTDDELAQQVTFEMMFPSVGQLGTRMVTSFNGKNAQIFLTVFRNTLRAAPTSDEWQRCTDALHTVLKQHSSDLSVAKRLGFTRYYNKLIVSHRVLEARDRGYNDLLAYLVCFLQCMIVALDSDERAQLVADFSAVVEIYTPTGQL